MLRRAVRGVGGAVLLYLLVYAVLSLLGHPHRYVESFVGPTVKDEWMPRGFTHPSVVDLFWPPYVLDRAFCHPDQTEPGWHYDAHGTAAQSLPK